MKRTTVFLDDATLRRARQLARREGKSFAQVVREALAARLVAGSRTERERGGLPSFAGRFAGGHRDTSQRADELLWNDPHA